MTAKVVRLDDRRDPQQRRDNKVIEVFETPLTDWSKPTSNDSKRRNSK